MNDEPMIIGKRKSKVIEMMPRVLEIIIDGKANGTKGRLPVTRLDIAQKTGLSLNSVSKAVKLLREQQGAAIMPVKGGLAPSSAATVQDDIRLMRITNSMISSRFITISNCKDDILKRWPERTKRRMMLGAMAPVAKAAQIGFQSMKVLEGKL